jgi:hypothetical protein
LQRSAHRSGFVAYFDRNFHQRMATLVELGFPDSDSAWINAQRDMTRPLAGWWDRVFLK